MYYWYLVGETLCIVEESPHASQVAAVTQTLLHTQGAHDLEWHNLSFKHAGWSTPSTEGIVERYGGTLFKLNKPKGSCNLTPSPAVCPAPSHPTLWTSSYRGSPETPSVTAPVKSRCVGGVPGESPLALPSCPP